MCFLGLTAERPELKSRSRRKCRSTDIKITCVYRPRSTWGEDPTHTATDEDGWPSDRRTQERNAHWDDRDMNMASSGVWPLPDGGGF